MYLHWKMIDFKRACAFLPTSKSGEPRAVPLPGVIDSLKVRSKVRRPRRANLIAPSRETAPKTTRAAAGRLSGAKPQHRER